MYQICKRVETDGPDKPADWLNFGPEFEEQNEVVSYIQDTLPDCDSWFEYYVEDRWVHDEEGWQDSETMTLEDFMNEWEDTDEVLGLEKGE